MIRRIFAGFRLNKAALPQRNLYPTRPSPSELETSCVLLHKMQNMLDTAADARPAATQTIR